MKLQKELPPILEPEHKTQKTSSKHLLKTLLLSPSSKPTARRKKRRAFIFLPRTRSQARRIVNCAYNNFYRQKSRFLSRFFNEPPL